MRTQKKAQAAWVLVLFGPFLSLWAGGVRPESAVFLAGAAALAVALSWPLPTLKSVPKILWLLALAAGWQTWLALPWPSGVAEILTPASQGLRAHVWQALWQPPSWTPLALDGKATALDAARLWATFALTLVVAQRASQKQSVSALFQTTALAGIAHVALALLWPQGFAARDSSTTWVMGGFINRNHQAAFFNIAWSFSLVAALLSSGWKRLGWAAAAAVLGAASAMCLSRGGLLAALFGAMVWAWWAPKRLRVRLGLGFLSTGALAAVVIVEGIGQRFAAPEFWIKLKLFGPAAALSTAYPFGAGRGGFAAAFNLIRTAEFPLRYDFVENEYLQALIDYGPLVGAAAIVAAIWVLVRLWQLTQKPPESSHQVKALGVFAAGVMLAVQNGVDFNWEMSGIFVPLWCGLSALGRPLARDFAPSAFVKPRVTAKVAQLGAATLALGCAALGAWAEPHALLRQHRWQELVRVRPFDALPMQQLAVEQFEGAKLVRKRWHGSAGQHSLTRLGLHRICLRQTFCVLRQRPNAKGDLSFGLHSSFCQKKSQPSRDCLLSA